MVEFEVMGELSTLTSPIYVLKGDDGEYYLARDIEKFKSVGWSAQIQQRIARVIGKTIFLNGGVVDIYLYNDEHKKTFAKLREIFKEDEEDDTLRAIVSGAHGADFANIEVFKDIRKVLTQFSISDLLGKGGGYYTDEVNLIVALDKGGKKRVFIEEVVGYPEGYSITYTEIPELVFRVSQLDIVKKVFSEKIRNLEGYIYEDEEGGNDD